MGNKKLPRRAGYGYGVAGNRHLSATARHLEMAAEQAQTLKADVDNQSACSMNAWSHSTKRWSSPLRRDGIYFWWAYAARGSQQCCLNAGGDISVGVMGNTTALAGTKSACSPAPGNWAWRPAKARTATCGCLRRRSWPFLQKVTFVYRQETHYANWRWQLPETGAGKVEYGTTATYMRRVKRTIRRLRRICRWHSPVWVLRISIGYLSVAGQTRPYSGQYPLSLTTPSGQTVTGYSDNEGRSVRFIPTNRRMWNCIFLLKNHTRRNDVVCGGNRYSATGNRTMESQS